MGGRADERNKRFHRSIVSVGEAQDRILNKISLGSVETVPLMQSFGRRLGQAIHADHPMPHFPRSGVDGYALRSADVRNAALGQPATLTVVETIACGSMPVGAIGCGEAARIMTGAHIPDGADAVVMLEMTDSPDSVGRDGRVSVRKSVFPGENITPVGNELKQGDLMMEAGRHIGAGEVSLLAATGWAEVPVFRKPVVAVLSSGSELLPVGAELEPAKIRNSNSYMVSLLVEEAGGTALWMNPLIDSLDETERVLAEAMRLADIVITTGGVSVGDYDMLTAWFGRREQDMLFNKVAMRPGSPTTAGMSEGKLIVALSGNPGACFVGFKLFAEPAMKAMMGAKDPLPREYWAILGTDFPKPSPYARYVRGYSVVEQGSVLVYPSGKDKSSIVTSIKDANGLIIIPAGGKGLAAGSLTTFIDFRE